VTSATLEERHLEPVPGPGRASVARNATMLAIANVAARACALGLTIALGRGLGVGQYGRYGFAVAVAMIIVPIADLGLTDYVWREAARGGAGGHAQARRMAEIKLGLSLATLGLTTAAAMLIAGPGSAAVIVIVLAFTLADGVSAFVFGFFQGREQMRFEAEWTVLTALLRSIGGIALVLGFGTLLPVLGWMLAISALQLAVAARRLRTAVSVPDGEGSAPRAIVWRSVLAMGALSVSVLIYIRADSVILGLSRGHRSVGLYTAAYAIMGAAQIIPLQISQAVTPVFSRTFGTDQGAFRRTWDEGLRAALLLALPLALVTTVLGATILTIPYGAGFRPAGAALAVLVWAGPLGVVNAMVAAVLYAAARERWAAVVSMIAVVLNVALNVALIPSFGIVGAAVVTVATESIVLALQLAYAFRAGVVAAPRLPYGPLLVSLLVLGAVGVTTRSLGAPIAGVLALAAYAIAAIATGAVDRRVVRTALRRLRRRSS